MRLWKAWFDIRQRFILCVVLVTLLMAPGAVEVAVSSARAAAEVAASGTDPQADVLDASLAFDHMIGGWIRGNAQGIFAILGIVLAVGGILSTGNARSNLMTLSLPAKRRHWLMAQATVAALLLLALCAWEAAIMAVTGWLSGLEVPLGQLFLAIGLTSFTAALWIWPAILTTSFTREPVRAALIVVSIQVAWQTTLGVTDFPNLRIRRLADVQGWGEAVPWAPLLLYLPLAGLTAAWALRRFRKMEF